MSPVRLNETHFFTIEHDGKTVRLIVTYGTNELVCRKETMSRLNRFCIERDSRIFKGRLQLIKIDKTISIEIKGSIIGKIATTLFLKYLNDNEL